jgi:dipeptidyl aminopeptidase/acylaminoacyl peptidase
MFRFAKFFIYTFLLINTFSTSTHAADKPLVPLKDFLSPSLVQAGSISLSPDGNYLAVIVPRDNRSDLFIFDRASMKPTASVTPGKNEYISDYWWVSSRRVIATLAIKEGGLETPSETGELWGVDVDGKNNKYLFGYRGGGGLGTHIDTVLQAYASATVLEPIADDKSTILIGITPWSSGEVPFMSLARINVLNGRLITAEGRLPIRYSSNTLTDHDGILKFVSGHTEERYSQLFYRPDSKSPWVKINDEKESGRVIEPVAYSQDNRKVYAVISDSKSPDYLVLLDPSNKAEKLVYRPDVADVGALHLTANRKDAYALRTYDGRGGYVFLNSDLAETKLTKDMMLLFPGELVIANSFSADGKFATVVVTSDVNPGEYYLFDRDQKKLKMIFKARPNIDINQSASVEPIEFKARDGLTLHGWLTRPNNANAKTPLIVLPHGGPYGIVDRWGYDSETQLLASRGYTVLQINFRGSGGYGKAFLDAGMGEWGGKMQLDITDATKWMIAQGKVDASKVCIYGASYGAYAAMMAVATEPGLFRCAIGYSGVYDLEIMRSKGDTDDTAYGRNYLSAIFPQDKNWLRQHSPTYLAPQIKVPVLLIHGGADRRTPPAHANAMRKALKQAGNEPEWIYKASEGHGFYDGENNLEVYTTMINFLDKHLTNKKE